MSEAAQKPGSAPSTEQGKPHAPEKQGAITTSAPPATPEEKAAEKGGG